MCGIAGIVNFKDKKIDNNKLKCMMESIRHRGPNDQGIFEFDGVGLVHTRLSIFDLSKAGHQPMISDCEQFVIVFNGEVYNWPEIRRMLKRKVWKSKTDTETILYAFIEKGVECLNLFNGMFAFVIYDKRNKKIFAARDRVGIKPFYYGIQNEELYFGSEIKALISAGFKKKANQEAIYDFLRWGMIDHCDQTFFENIFSLKPGHFLNIDSNGDIKENRYWDLAEITLKNSVSDLPEAVEQYESLLEDAIDLRMRADVKVGSFLSGGVDSSILTSRLVRKLDKKNIECYTYEFDTGGVGEGQYAKQVASSLGISNKMSVLAHKDVPTYFEKVLWNEEMPVTSLRVLAAHKLYEDYKDGTTIILEGHGGDHLGAGFEYYFVPYIMDMINSCGAEQGINELYKFMDIYGVSPKDQLKKFFNGIWSVANLGSSTQDGTPFIKQECISDDLLSSNNHLRVKFEKKFKSNLLSIQYTDLFHHNLPRVLRYADRGSMAVGRETRVPFLDHRLIEFSFSTTTQARVNGANQRYFMREAAKNLLPESILNQPKRSIVDPQRAWMQKELKDWIMEIFNSKSFKERGIFNQEEVIKEYKHYCDQEKPATGFHIFQYINIEMWYRLMIDHNEKN